MDCNAIGWDRPVCSVCGKVGHAAVESHGLDVHCCKKVFAEKFPTKPSCMRLRDAQGKSIPLSGQRRVRMHTTMFDKQLVPLQASAMFQVGGFARNLFSVGMLYDEDFDIVISKRTYVGKEGKKGYRVVPMERLRNTFGVSRVHVDNGMSETSQGDVGEGVCGGIEEGGAAGSDGRGYVPRNFHEDPPASFAEPPLEL
eukprot:6159274-Amphidinium_carterae.1